MIELKDIPEEEIDRLGKWYSERISKEGMIAYQQAIQTRANYSLEAKFQNFIHSVGHLTILSHELFEGKKETLEFIVHATIMSQVVDNLIMQLGFKICEEKYNKDLTPDMEELNRIMRL